MDEDSGDEDFSGIYPWNSELSKIVYAKRLNSDKGAFWYKLSWKNKWFVYCLGTFKDFDSEETGWMNNNYY